MNNKAIPTLRPQDLVVLLKLLLEKEGAWNQISLAKSLSISQSEISASLKRSAYARLLQNKGKAVARQPFLDLLQYGVPFMFPQQPGAVVRGIPTAHSAEPLVHLISSSENFVWPYAKGHMRGHSILPLYPSVIQAVDLDPQLYEYLALIDAIRVGRAREKNLALELLRTKIC
ncbi:MAG: hypothetical protein Q7T20_19795 [Saprospiraceae bacterium]|nr:hypothetical protein [Saprospiraceae bacterium]